MTDRELMQQALEALEKIAAYRPLTFAECSDAEAVMGIAENAIPVLRERLAQPDMPLFDDWPQFACPPCNHNCNQGRECPNK